MEKKVLEILVDKNNEKGPGVFEHILIVLHKVFDDFEKKKIFKKDKNFIQPTFSFEITKVANRIRFFIVAPNKYSNFLVNQIYAHYNNVEIIEVGDYLENIPNDKMYIGNIELEKHYLFPIKSFTELQEEASKDTVDPFSSITSALGRTGKYTLNTFQINFTPVISKKWKKGLSGTIKILLSNYPDFLKKILLNPKVIYLKILLFPLILLFKIFGLFFKKSKKTDGGTSDEILDDNSKDELTDTVEEKISVPKYMKNKLILEGFLTSINVIHAGEDQVEAKSTIREIYSTLNVFSNFGINSFKLGKISNEFTEIQKVKNREINGEMLLTTNELSGLVHLPTSYVKTPQINWVIARAFEPPSNLPIIDSDLGDNVDPADSDLTPIGISNFRGTNISFGIGPNDRRRHMYVLGKTGMGKSTLLENMIIDDIRKGRGVAVIDPHGDLAEAVIGFIPKSRTNQTIIFDPSDTDWPIAFNMLDDVNPELRPLVASGLVGIFKKIFGDSWGPRLEHILRNTILALLEYPNSTLISIPLMLTSDVFRSKVVNKISDPVVKKFWTGEFAKMAPNQKVEAAGPILNKVGQFLSSTILRNVLGQPKNSFSIRWAMDNKKIIIINLSKGKIGEDASALLGAMMVTKFQMDAMSRADIAESKREDFYLYVDEFQNFATDSFATILSEARKYKLNLVMANQYIDQMQESVRGAVFGNVGSIVSFQVGYHDASILKEVLTGEISEDDLMNLKKYNIYTKQLIDGMPSPVFSASTFSPNKKNDEVFSSRYAKILSVSREKYSKPRKSVEGKINKSLEDVEKQEQEWDKKKAEFEDKKKEEKAKKHAELIAKQMETKKE
ncbi:MAG: type IV secretion system DNA-binding domain-containing protein [Candidatus Gracilibacteria bacterium]|nr:type IV secretion system DNA-binding domain-containing protein [Candidatus Gracilibacteria bacterium]